MATTSIAVFSFGLFGLILLLVAFTLNSFGKISPGLYNLANFFGALLLCVYATVTKVYIFVVLEIIWAIVALYHFHPIKFLKEKTNN